MSVLLRFRQSLFITSDLSAQIGTALKFLSGDGFGNYSLLPNSEKGIELAVSPLTLFSPGLSVILSLFLKTGIPLPLLLKIIYSISTLFGWFCWGLLFAESISLGAGFSRLKTALLSLAAIPTAILLPLFYTLDWNRTDLIYWSGIPALILLCLALPFLKGVIQILFSFWSGLLVGFLYFIRYAALSLVPSFFIFAFLQRQKRSNLPFFLFGFLCFYGGISLFKRVVSEKAFLYWNLFSASTLFDIPLTLQKLKLIILSPPRFIGQDYYSSLRARTLVVKLYWSGNDDNCRFDLRFILRQPASSGSPAASRGFSSLAACLVQSCHRIGLGVAADSLRILFACES